MNLPASRSPSDRELDLLLARGYRDTSPQFEARWVALKREWRRAPPRPVWRGWRLTGWLGFAAAALAALLLLHREPPPSVELTPEWRELLALEAALAPAEPLLDADNRAVLLHFTYADARPD